MTASLPPPKDHPRYGEWYDAYRKALVAREIYAASQGDDGAPPGMTLPKLREWVAATEAAYKATCTEIEAAAEHPAPELKGRFSRPLSSGGSITTIYMPLDEEGTDVWRPVQAESLGAGKFRVVGPMPEGEVWRFVPGTVVSARHRKFVDGTEGEEAVAFAP